MPKKLFLTFLIWINLFFIFPCGWDSDTIAMEKRTFPSVHELITGKFLQHSQAFYYWRVNDRTEKIQLYPDSLNYYDDLAWALNKVGQPEKGVNVMLRKEKKSPGLYETYANLGTCYIHANQFEKGLKYIKKAIEINPNAHFGREIYQQHLVEYVISKKDSSGNFTLPLGTKTDNFFHYLKKHHFKGANQDEIATAVKGVGGMMKFSNHNSPILLEALGDLLSQANTGVDPGAGHLSSRAYLKAAFLLKDENQQKAFKKKAQREIERQYPDDRFRRNLSEADDINPEFVHPVISLKDLEAVLKLEIEAANAWVNKIHQNELSWIEKGLNPDSAFTATYYEEPISPDISMYLARKMAVKIDENYWLNQQLENIQTIDQMYTILALPDSTKNWVDSIYKLEFAQIPEVSIEKSDDSKNQDGLKTSTSTLIWISLIGSVVLVLLFLLGRKFFTNRN